MSFCLMHELREFLTHIRPIKRTDGQRRDALEVVVDQRFVMLRFRYGNSLSSD